MRNSASLKHPASAWRGAPAAQRAAQAREQTEFQARRRWLSLTMVALVVPAALLLVSALLAGLPPSSNEIERGVRVAGVPVEGDTWQQAQVDLQARYDAYLDDPFTLRIDDRDVSVTPADLGIGVDMAATMERARHIGRGSMVDAAGERLHAHTRGIDLDPVVSIDSKTFLAALYQLSGPVIRAPLDATYSWQGGQLAVVASEDGVGIDTQKMLELTRDHVANLSDEPLVVPIVALPPAVSTNDLTGAVGEAVEMAGTPAYLTFDGTWWQLRPADIARLLTFGDGHVVLDRAKLSAAVGSLAQSIDREAQDASISAVGDGTFQITPEIDKRTLDVPASVAAVLQAFSGDERQIALVVASETPEVTTAHLTPLLERANAIVARGIAVGWPEGEQWLDKPGLASTVRFDAINGVVTFDHAGLAGLIEPIAEQINRPAAGLRWRDGSLVPEGDVLPGRVVDLGASANAIASAALGGQDHVPLVINESSDPAQSASEIVIREMLSSASTYYGSSSANRLTNVELAAAALDGALVPPGGTFSFNNAIGGTATLDDGYQMGYGIMVGTDGTPHTVPSVAGGICQVATTVFQAAFWSGMPIGTRNWHLYWIPNYGSGPGGMTGLDATVDPDYGLDFTFDNPTSDWLAIRAVADGEWLTVEIWGTSQGWQVHADDPVISNVVKADPTPRKQFSDQLEPGQEVVVEHAEDGFTAEIHRVVTKDGEVVSDITLTSYYLPSHNVTLVGPGVSLDDEPTATPEPTVVPDDTPVTDETPVVDETPVQETPVENAPVEDTPTEEAPLVDATPADENQVDPEATTPSGE